MKACHQLSNLGIIISRRSHRSQHDECPSNNIKTMLSPCVTMTPHWDVVTLLTHWATLNINIAR